MKTIMIIKFLYLIASTFLLAKFQHDNNINQAFTDVLALLFWFVGLIIMLTADYQDSKIKIERPIPYLIFSIFTSTAIVMIVIILNIDKLFPIWGYYPLILGGAIFSPNIVRKFIKEAPNLTVKFVQKKLDINDEVTDKTKEEDGNN